jgi:hypothetical protein
MTRPFARGTARIPLAAMVILLAPSAMGPTGYARGQASGPEFWLVQTRDCPQILGADPWSTLQVSRLDEKGRLAKRKPSELPTATAGRPVVILVHGSYYSAEMAAAEGLQIRDSLEATLPLEAVVIAFDWPSQRVYPNPIRDANDKARRAFVAGYHLARFLGRFPPRSRVCLVGHSHGGLAVQAALHLLGATPPLRLRAVLIAPASDRQWIDPGDRLGRSLTATEGVLCLFNPLDPVLPVHPFGRYSDGRRALGVAGLRRIDEGRLGALAARYREINIAPLLGARHTFGGSVELPAVAEWIGTHAWRGTAPGRPP